MPQAYIQSKPPQYDDLHQHLFQLVEAVSPHPLKVILETVFLSPEQIAAAALIAAESGCAFVKTSTGFCGGGANVRDVGVMKACVEGYEWSGARDRVQVKASGGVRSFDTWKEMVEAGATRIGT
jgi:deoxyribose-phosphate aldolase